MSNERIDLTQFEGISPAKEWGLVYPERPQRTCVQTGDGLYHPHCRADDIEVRRANMALMAAGPDLLAELKRCYEEIDALRSITQDWVKIETFTDDGKDLSVDMEDSDGNCFSGYINRASE